MKEVLSQVQSTKSMRQFVLKETKYLIWTDPWSSPTQCIWPEIFVIRSQHCPGTAKPSSCYNSRHGKASYLIITLLGSPVHAVAKALLYLLSVTWTSYRGFCALPGLWKLIVSHWKGTLRLRWFQYCLVYVSFCFSFTKGVSSRKQYFFSLLLGTKHFFYHLVCLEASCRYVWK